MIDFQKQWDAGLATKDFPKLVALHERGVLVLKSLGAKDVIEIGSGLGAFLKAASNLDFPARGFDPDQQCRTFAIFKGVARDAYLTEEPETYEADAIYCTEVFEHLTDEQIDAILSKCKSRLFYFTSTPFKTDEDEYWGHINVKVLHDWVEIFKDYGYTPLKFCSAVATWGIIFKSTAID